MSARSFCFALLVASAFAPAQVTTHSLVLGEAGAKGCNTPPTDPPRLSDGSRASGVLDFSYDRVAHVLELVVTNTSPVQSTALNPILTDLAFSLPEGAITDVTLLSQAPTGPDLPIFQLAVDYDRVAPPNLTMECLGDFSLRIFVPFGIGGIGNAAANGFLFPPPLLVKGPMTFRLQLAGPGVGSLTARTLARGFSQATANQVHAAFRFQWAGSPWPFGQGVVADVPQPDDNDGSVWWNNPPRIGQRLDYCTRGPIGAHGCVFGSFNPEPLPVPPWLIPIGPPFTFLLVLPPFPDNNALCIPTNIPDDPRLIGQAMYFTMGILTFEEFLKITFTPRVELKFLE
jgi:hypothetical protein